MNILIPLGGLGQRFKDVGYEFQTINQGIR